jgi:hypothetical protein
MRVWPMPWVPRMAHRPWAARAARTAPSAAAGRVNTACVSRTAIVTAPPVAVASAVSRSSRSAAGSADCTVIFTPSASSPQIAMPALSGPRSVSVTSITVSIAPRCGCMSASFGNRPTIPHMAASVSRRGARMPVAQQPGKTGHKPIRRHGAP